jgi:hypothetical protein
MPFQLPTLANLKVRQKLIERLRAELPLEKPDPTVLPDLSVVVQKFLQFQIGAAGSLSAGAASGDVFQEAGVADGNWQVTNRGTANNNGLQFVLAAGGYVSWCKGQPVEQQRVLHRCPGGLARTSSRIAMRFGLPFLADLRTPAP